MIAAMREFDASTLPAPMLVDFIRFRSRVHAINERITEIYTGEGKGSAPHRAATKARRKSRLNSAVEVWKEAVGYFEQLDATADSLGGATQMLTKPVEMVGYQYPGDGK